MKHDYVLRVVSRTCVIDIVREAYLSLKDYLLGKLCCLVVVGTGRVLDSFLL